MQSTFVSLFLVGSMMLFCVHFIVHVGGNLGLLPITGTTLPFMSYGGTHILTGLFVLGMCMSWPIPTVASWQDIQAEDIFS